LEWQHLHQGSHSIDCPLAFARVEWHAQRPQVADRAIEAKQARDAARRLARACADSDVDAFFKAVDFVNTMVDGWRPAMLHVSRLERVSNEIKSAFAPVRVEKKARSARAV